VWPGAKEPGRPRGHVVKVSPVSAPVKMKKDHRLVLARKGAPWIQQIGRGRGARIVDWPRRVG